MEKELPRKKFKKGGKVLQKSKREMPPSILSVYHGINLEILQPTEPSCKNKLGFFWRLWSYDVNLIEDEPIYRERLLELEEFETHEDLETSPTTYIISDGYEDSDFDLNVYRSCSYCIFKYGIEPVWEDDGNYNGGRFVAWIYSQQEDASEALASYWRNLTKKLVDGDFEDLTKHVCGAKVLYIPESPVNKISLWTTEDVYKEPALQERIKEKLEVEFKSVACPFTTVDIDQFQPHQKRDDYEGYVEMLTKFFWIN